MPILGSRGAGSASAFGLTSGAAKIELDYLVVAGGGAGGGPSYPHMGGGGAGGYRTSFPGGTKIELASGTTVPITVGAGGSNGSISVRASSGNDSVFDIITSTGGGRGGGWATPGAAECNAGDPGGSGGGGGGQPAPRPGGTGNQPPFSPPQGNPGGSSKFPHAPAYNAGGGGGASQAGVPGDAGNAGDGGDGSYNLISGSPVAYAGGGGGNVYPGGTAGSGGVGGGGNGVVQAPATPTAQPGTANTGGGGGGGDTTGSGGSGIVIVRSPSTASLVASPPTNTVTSLPAGCKVATFTVSGTLTVS